MRGAALALSCVLLTSAIAPRYALAESSESEPKKTPNQIKAEHHYKRARELYSLGRYREAIAQLEAALKLDPGGAELLYNLALVHEKLGEADEAIDAYKRYLKVLGPDADEEEVRKIKGIIKRLEGAKTELKAREAKRMEHRFTPLSASLLVGAGVSALVTGVFGVAALRHDREARELVIVDGRGFEERQQIIRASKSEANIANVFGVVAVLAAGAGLTLYLTSEFPRQDDPNEAPPPPKSSAKLRVGPGSVLMEVTF
jgi:tetratricopeptide (TPR) repeat protein